MMQGKVHIGRIRKISNRQVNFCKRRRGLFKRARELAILCDAQVAVITVSSSGKMYKFSSPSSSMKVILDHYAKTIMQKTRSKDSHRLQHISDGVEDQFNISLQNLECLDMRMLNELEHLLHMRLGYVTEILNRKILEQIDDLNRTERYLLEENKTLQEMVAKSLQQRNVHSAEAGKDEAVPTLAPPSP